MRLGARSGLLSEYGIAGILPWQKETMPVSLYYPLPKTTLIASMVSTTEVTNT